NHVTFLKPDIAFAHTPQWTSTRQVDFPGFLGDGRHRDEWKLATRVQCVEIGGWIYGGDRLDLRPSPSLRHRPRFVDLRQIFNFLHQRDAACHYATNTSESSSSSAGNRAPKSARARTIPPRPENSGASIMSSGLISTLTAR